RGTDQAHAAEVGASRCHRRARAGLDRIQAGGYGQCADDAGGVGRTDRAAAQPHRRRWRAAPALKGQHMDSDLRALSDRACITGVGQTDYSKASGRSVQTLALQATRNAVADAGLKPSDIDAILPYVLGPTSDEMA